MSTVRAVLLYTTVSAALVISALGGHARSIISALPVERTDALQFYWDGWWFQRSFLHGGNPYYCHLVFAPNGVPLVYHSVDPLQSGLMAVIGLIAPLWAAYDIVIGLGLILAGVGAYLLCMTVTRNQWASLTGGLVFLLCPFIIGKAGAGHLNMLFAGITALFLATLLKCLVEGRDRRWQLAGAWLLVVFSSLVNAILAANVGVIVILWSVIVLRKHSAAEHAKLLLPMVLVTIPLVAGVAYYSLKYGVSPEPTSHYSNIPEPVSYLLPFTPTSAYSTVIQRVMNVHPDLMRFDNSAYLGWLTFPFALAGLWLNREKPVVRLLAVLLVFFLVISLGPTLLVHRVPVRILGLQAHLPFALWNRIPVVGAMWQSGRYLAIVYMVIAAGIALFISRCDRKGLCALVLAALVCVDYLPHLTAKPLPPSLPNTLFREEGNVLDARRTGLAMYYQTEDHRPMVGGYLNRSPKRALDEYRAVAGMDCLFWGEHCVDKAVARSAAIRFSISHVLVAAGDPRGPLFESFGFVRAYADAYTEVWEVR